MCGISFDQKSSLTRHIRTVHAGAGVYIHIALFELCLSPWLLL